jgi:hypothetical protein
MAVYTGEYMYIVCRAILAVYTTECMYLVDRVSGNRVYRLFCAVCTTEYIIIMFAVAESVDNTNTVSTGQRCLHYI